MTVKDLKNILAQLDDDDPVVITYDSVMTTSDVEQFLNFSTCYSTAKGRNQLDIEIVKK